MWKATRAIINPKLRAEQIGAEETYFEKFLKSKPLEIIYETPQHYIRVKDSNGEEWGLYKGQYAVDTEIPIPKTD